MNFKIEKKIEGKLGRPACAGRAGTLTTPHGVILTPAFIAVGTKATVKGILPEQFAELGIQAVLGNAYHLYLQPGIETIAQSGGLNKFMNFDGPTMTDSGGFQVFSLGAAFGKGISKVVAEKDVSKLIPERAISDPVIPLAKIGADGVSFKSHLDGTIHYFTPEKSIEIQHAIGADIIVAFDECTSPTENRQYQIDALERTHAWAKRSLDHHSNILTNVRMKSPALFGVVQGGRIEELRRKSAQFLANLETKDGKKFDGFAIGGSFDKKDLHSAVSWVCEELPENKPRHLLGIGEPEDLFLGTEFGVDTFDCVAPTRNGRSGTLYTHTGKINIDNARFSNDLFPIDSECDCPICLPDPRSGFSGQKYTKSYLHHLYQGHEMLGPILGTMHNLYFINKLMSQIRQSILDDRFEEFKNSFLAKYGVNPHTKQSQIQNDYKWC